MRQILLAGFTVALALLSTTQLDAQTCTVGDPIALVGDPENDANVEIHYFGNDGLPGRSTYVVSGQSYICPLDIKTLQQSYDEIVLFEVPDEFFPAGVCDDEGDCFDHCKGESGNDPCEGHGGFDEEEGFWQLDSTNNKCYCTCSDGTPTFTLCAN